MFIRSVINSELKDLRPSSQPVTEFLFGDNLSHVIKELNLTNKLGCRPINKHSYSRNRSYARSKGYYKQNSFLGRARAKTPAETITQNKMVSFKSLLLIKVMLPNAKNGKRHVYTVPAKLCRPQNDLRKKHSYSYFAMALVKIARELEKLFGTILFFLVPR